MLVDTNILLYAIDETSPFHHSASGWLENALNGAQRVGLPWAVLIAFVRIATYGPALREPLTPLEASEFVDEWLAAPATWVPEPGIGFHEVFRRLVVDLDLRGKLVPDAALAALCIEHGLQLISADSDFARFSEIDWFNPCAR